MLGCGTAGAGSSPPSGMTRWDLESVNDMLGGSPYRMVPVAMSARLRISVAAILALLLAGFGNGRAAELVLPSATEILAHVADVAGPLPAREHLTIAFTSASLS